MNNKVYLRDLYKKKRNLLDSDMLAQISNNCVEQINPFDFNNKIVSVFLPIQKFNEIDTSFIIQKIIKNGGAVCVSRSDFQEKKMAFFIYEGPAQIKENKFGIPEPSYGNSCDILKIDYVFVPLLCFDEVGNRVGYGQGFYDKFLSSCSDNCIKIGLSHFEPVKKIDDCNDMDIKLDFCITPNKTYAFR
jgi:5-formyltetrahydrofolate cyclo-ligase